MAWAFFFERASPNEAFEIVNLASAKLNGAFREVSNPRTTREVVCAEVNKASQRTSECKRKASEAHESVLSHRERTRRIKKEHTRAEAAANHSLGNLGCCVKEAATATHSSTFAVPDRESNEFVFSNKPLSSSWSGRINLKEYHP